MIRDELGIYAKDTTPVTTVQLGDILDHKEDGYALGGHQRPTKLVIIVRTSFVESLSTQFVLQADDAEGFGTKRDIASSQDILTADLVSGKVIEIPIPPTAGRYTRVVPVVTPDEAAVEATGTVDAFLTY